MRHVIPKRRADGGGHRCSDGGLTKPRLPRLLLSLQLSVPP